MKITTEKNCYCHTCQREFHYLGINSHRAAHRRRREDCEITFTYGNRSIFQFSKIKPHNAAVKLRRHED